SRKSPSTATGGDRASTEPSVTQTPMTPPRMAMTTRDRRVAGTPMAAPGRTPAASANPCAGSPIRMTAAAGSAASSPRTAADHRQARAGAAADIRTTLLIDPTRSASGDHRRDRGRHDEDGAAEHGHGEAGPGGDRPDQQGADRGAGVV